MYMEEESMDKIAFKDVIAEHLNRYQLIKVVGTEDQYDLVPVYGTVSQEGTPVRALELNELQENIDASKQDYITAQGILKGDGSGGVSTAVAGTDYATPEQLNGKLDKTGGTINGALDIANASSLKFLNPNMQGMMLKTNVDGVVCEATPGTDYDKAEIGTWTPVLQGYSGTAPTVSYSSRYGDYMKIGNMVWFRCGINATISNAGTGYATISGLPFAAYPMAKNRANYAVTVGECYGLLSGATSTAGTTSTVFASINAIVLSEADGNTMRKWAADWGSIALSGFYITA